jgi:hypothetical protein
MWCSSEVWRQAASRKNFIDNPVGTAGLFHHGISSIAGQFGTGADQAQLTRPNPKRTKSVRQQKRRLLAASGIVDEAMHCAKTVRTVFASGVTAKPVAKVQFHAWDCKRRRGD